jgi:hypothetical protein
MVVNRPYWVLGMVEDSACVVRENWLAILRDDLPTRNISILMRRRAQNMLNDGRTLRFRRLFKPFYFSLFPSPLTNNYGKKIAWRSNDPSPATSPHHPPTTSSHTNRLKNLIRELYYGQKISQSSCTEWVRLPLRAHVTIGSYVHVIRVRTTLGWLRCNYASFLLFEKGIATTIISLPSIKWTVSSIPLSHLHNEK